MSSLGTIWDLPIVDWVLVATLLSGAVFVVVRGLDAALARVLAPRVRMVLYALVLLRVVLPPDFSSPYGVFGRSQPAPATATPTTVAPDAHKTATQLEAPAVTVPWLSRNGAVANPGEPSFTAAWGTWIYSLGIALVLGVAALRRRDLNRIVAESRSASGSAAGWGRGIARPHPSDGGPLAAGHFRRVIVLPRPLVERLEKPALRWVVAHERAHHDGGDPWLATALTLVTALAWPVIPVWLAARRARVLIEHAADERAVRTSAGTRKSYGRVLLDLVADAPARPAAVGLGAYRGLRSRIAAVVRPATAPAAAQLGLSAGVAGIVVACAAVPTADETVARTADCDALKSEAARAHEDAEREGRFEVALAAYDAYLGACADDTDYADLTYYAGELRWAAAAAAQRAGDTRAAARGYARAQRYFDAAIEEGSKFTDDAAYAHLMSVRKATGWTPAPSAAPCEACEPLAFVPYADDEREVIASWERFVEVHGRPVDDAENLLLMARLRMQHNDFQAARADLEDLVDTQAGTEAGLAGAEMLVDALTIAWTNAPEGEQAAVGAVLADRLRRIRSSDTWAMPGAARLREAVPTLSAGVEWKAAMHELATAEASGSAAAYRRCAARFQALAETYPDHAQVEIMRRNADQCLAATSGDGQTQP